MNVNKTSTWSGGSIGKTTGSSDGPTSAGKLPIQPGTSSSASTTTSTDTFTTSTSTSTSVNLTGT